MRHHRGRLDPFDAVLRERKRPEKGRCGGRGVHGGTDVVHEARPRQLGRPATAADGALRFEDGDLPPSLCKRDRGSETVRSRANHDRVGLRHRSILRQVSYWYSRFLFERALAAMYLVGFAVAANQFVPLLGQRGLLPVSRFTQFVPFRSSPSLFFLSPTDTAFRVCAWLGIGLAVLALTGWPQQRGTMVSGIVWALMWVLYLSFVNVGQTFYSFGWESLLLESGFLAIFLGARNVAPPVIVMWLFRWVLFRLMFGAGLIKLRGDPCWRDLTCLVYHYETQPIPNTLSWYFHQLPVPFHKAGVLFNHLVELILPFGYL